MLANLYPLVCVSKGQQKIFRDAFPRQVPAEVDEFGNVEYALYALDDGESRRLRAIGRSRDVDAIRAEIQDALVGALPSGAEKTAVSDAFHRWSVNGVVAWRKGGHRALQDYLANELSAHIQQYRRRGKGSALLRQFINMVTYESKSAFHTCFANAWVELIPWLRKHRKLDSPSTHLLVLWHRQHLTRDGKLPFWGHVLSLHPISKWLMTQGPHRLALANYLKSVANTQPRWDLDNQENDAYWELVGLILVAIREYVSHLNVVETQRKNLGGGQDRVAEAAERSQEHPERLVFDELFRHRLGQCPNCESQQVAFVDYKVLSEAEQLLRAEYRCQACGGEIHLEAKGDELRELGRDRERDAGNR